MHLYILQQVSADGLCGARQQAYQSREKWSTFLVEREDKLELTCGLTYNESDIYTLHCTLCNLPFSANHNPEFQEGIFLHLKSA